jgi:transposase-like protein
VFAHGGQLQLVVPRSRSSNFYPMILAVIKDQDNESKKLAYELYQAGLTTLQVGDLICLRKFMANITANRQ